MNNFSQLGKTLTFTASGAKTGGQVLVLGNTIGIVAADVADGAVGELLTEGVFTVPKVSAAVITIGESLTWDASAGAFDDNLATPATGDITGAAAIAWEAAGNGITTLKVKLTGAAGTRT